MQIWCSICVLPFLILAIPKGFLLRLIKERVDPYKDWGPFLISCGIYQTCQSLEKGSLSQGGHWLASSSLLSSLKNVSRSPLFPCQDPWFDSFFPFIEFPIITTSLLPVFSFFWKPHWDMKTYLENGEKKSVNIKSPFHRKVSSCVTEGLSSSIQNWIRQKKTERMALCLSFQNTHLETNWTKKL